MTLDHLYEDLEAIVLKLETEARGTSDPELAGAVAVLCVFMGCLEHGRDLLPALALAVVPDVTRVLERRRGLARSERLH